MMKSFIEGNIVKHLVSLGLDVYNAKWCAEQGYKHYQKRVANSRDPFKDACDYAGLMAGQRSVTFKYKSPAKPSARRNKKPQEAFNFGDM